MSWWASKAWSARAVEFGCISKPETCALMLTGLIGVGWASKRKD